MARAQSGHTKRNGHVVTCLETSSATVPAALTHYACGTCGVQTLCGMFVIHFMLHHHHSVSLCIHEPQEISLFMGSVFECGVRMFAWDHDHSPHVLEGHNVA